MHLNLVQYKFYNASFEILKMYELAAMNLKLKDLEMLLKNQHFYINFRKKN